MPAQQRAACLLVPDTTYQTRYQSSPVRICVIDLGTNSFHAVIVDAYPNGTYKVVDRMKEMVRLGQSGLADHQLPEDAMDRGLQALKRIYTLAKGWDTREFLAYATSAIREAKNGGDFIERVKREVGLKIRPISGEQEAELIFLGIRRAVDLDEPSLLIDIGGGSVECIVVDGREPAFARSVKLGAARMTERFVHSDPLSEADETAMREHYRSVMEPVLQAARSHGVTAIVGSSGTAKSLGRLCVGTHGDDDRTVFQQVLDVDPYREALHWVIRSDAEGRVEHPDIDPKRVDQIGAGAVLLDTILDELPSVTHIKTSANALREGMVDHFIRQNYTRIRKLAPFSDVRRRSVHEIAFRFDWEERHAQHVAATATFLFDVLKDRYNGPKSDVELLEYAAILHDIGYHISHSGHHKHSRYLIQHSDLQGFQPDEKRILALVARYHRKSFPDESRHKRFRKLSKPNRERVRQLAGILRIAEGLDRSHFQNVAALEIDLTDDVLTIALDSKGDPELEIWAAGEESGLFREVFGIDVSIEEKDIRIEGDGIKMGPAPVTHAVPASSE
ncbi:exopolyphosphatase [Longibacter salinarum]|uniref:Exopolyphosphatase n=1 Tax=Longibacter salinarum TaxID=1850348 RepID=A0A2A8D1S3_9BACT|nr:Ppx/GppA phosphatase family protein [Longibacter salinarum]PEN14885.1 exopolyphosphatase [Longibacter salinarum]